MDLKEIYQRKVLNQELSLREFAARKIVLESRPSKVQVRIGGEGERVMEPSIFEKVSNELFEMAHFVDLLGVDDCFATQRWRPIYDVMKKYQAINWHTSTFLWLGDPIPWAMLSELGMIFGIVVQGASKKSWDAVCNWPMGFEGFVKNVGVLARAQSRAPRGGVYLIGKIHKASVRELSDYVKLAIDNGISEIRFVLDPSVETREISPSSVTEALELAVINGISLQLGDPRLLAGADQDLVSRASKAPAREHNFPPAEARDPAFDALHAWQPLDVKVNDRSRVSVYQRCFKPFHYVSVEIDGRIGPCNHLTEPFQSLGSLFSKSFAQIWNGEGFQSWRKALVSAQPEDNRCKWCFANRLSD